MDQYSETLALEYKAGCDDASGLSTVPGCCAADDPQRESFVRDLVPAEVSTYNVEGAETEKDKDDHGNSIASPVGSQFIRCATGYLATPPTARLVEETFTLLLTRL